MKRLPCVFAFVPLAFYSCLFAGCSTIVTSSASLGSNFDCDEHRIPRVYAGVANDVRFIRSDSEDVIIPIVDLPLSAVGDTLLLPWTIIMQSKHGDLCPGERP